MNKIYAINHYNFIDKIVKKKRKEMVDVIHSCLGQEELLDALDIGTTNDTDYESSNYLIKNLKNIKIFKSISDQKVNDFFFSKTLQKSITDDLTEEDVNEMKSDLVISNATIEHVGNFNNQIKMLSNIVKLSKKFFVVTTPNRKYPVDFHTKLPILHWLPKKIHRKILSFLKLDYFSKEENLNLLTENQIKIALNNINVRNYKISKIYLMGIVSNFIIIGKME